MKTLFLLVSLASLVSVLSIKATDTTNHFSLMVISKTQNQELKQDGAARYTVSYVSSYSQRTDIQSYVFEEPREGSISGMQYRGSVDRTVILPEDFAQVGDIICKTNIGTNVYLYATKLAVVLPSVEKTNMPSFHRGKHHQEQNPSFSVPANVGE